MQRFPNPRKTLVVCGFFFFLVFTANELMQDAAEAKRIQYHPVMGYLSNFSLPASLASFILAVLHPKRAAPLFLGILFILLVWFEFYPYNGGPDTFDPFDIAFDFLGICSSVAISVFVRTRRVPGGVKQHIQM